MLDDLRESLIELTTRQCFQNVEIINHQRGLMESADQIFPGARIHSGFPADRTVHHGQQRCWNLNMRNAAVINCRHESRNVANHSSAKTHDERLAIKSRRDHAVANHAGSLECFGCFACRNRDQNWAKAGYCQTLFCAHGEERCDIAVGNKGACLAA
jgi:hypothetical protein